MVGWHHRLIGHELGKTSGDGEGQGSLACCSPWGHRVRHDLATEQHTSTKAWNSSDGMGGEKPMTSSYPVSPQEGV